MQTHSSRIIICIYIKVNSKYVSGATFFKRGVNNICVQENGSSDSVFSFDIAFGIITISTVKPIEASETHTASKKIQ